MGYLPQAMVNYLALLGWGDGTENEFFTLEQLGKCLPFRSYVDLKTYLLLIFLSGYVGQLKSSQLSVSTKVVPSLILLS